MGSIRGNLGVKARSGIKRSLKIRRGGIYTLGMYCVVYKFKFGQKKVRKWSEGGQVMVISRSV